MPDLGELHRPFHPRAARAVSWALGVLTVVGALAVILMLPAAGVDYGPADATGTAALAVLICWFLSRQGGVSAHPDEEGLHVRNLIHSRRIEWAEVVSVGFGDGAPWAQLDLADGSTLAVMAIQRADGDHGRAEARRLATLVALHEPRG